MSFGLPSGIVAALVTTWFFMTALHGHLAGMPIGATVGSAAAQSVALLDDDTDFDLSGSSGAVDRAWAEPIADSSQRRADPARDPFLDSTPIHLARRTPHRHARAKHHQKILHHHH